jgi:hypothetical protein
VHENPLSLTRAPAPVPELSATVELLSDLNRSHFPDPTTEGQSGGYAPHARGLMRASDGSLWFALDRPNGPHVNQGTYYYRQDLVSGAWQLMGETEFLPPVAASATTLMKDDVIYTYAIGQYSAIIQESHFSTTDPTFRGSRQIYSGGSPLTVEAYPGAAVSPAGHRVVWWTEYPQYGTGTFVYLYDVGNGWEGPVVTPVDSYLGFAYFYAQFVSDTHLIMAGELFRRGATEFSVVFQAEVAELEIGQQLELVAGLYSHTGDIIRSVSDLWVDPSTGDVHILAESEGYRSGDDYTFNLQSRSLYYFHKPANEAWAENNYALYRFDNTFRGRFLVSPTDLKLIRGDTNGGGIRVATVARADIDGALDWETIPEMQLADLPFGFVMADGIWTETPFLQTEPVVGTSFVFTGHWPVQDRYLWHVELE